MKLEQKKNFHFDNYEPTEKKTQIRLLSNCFFPSFWIERTSDFTLDMLNQLRLYAQVILTIHPEKKTAIHIKCKCSNFVIL